MKKCPYCAEEIQDEAVKCKHCHEFLDESQRPTLPFHQVPPVPAEPALPWYFKTSFLIFTFFSVPPLVLPSVWWHPKLHPVWKIVITLAVAAFCWITYTAILGLIKQMDEAAEMFKSMRI